MLDVVRRLDRVWEKGDVDRFDKGLFKFRKEFIVVWISVEEIGKKGLILEILME